MLAFTDIKCPSNLIKPNNYNYNVHTSESVCTIISTSFSRVNNYILDWLGRKLYQANKNNVTTVKDSKHTSAPLIH